MGSSESLTPPSDEGILKSAGRAVTMGLGVRVMKGDATGYAYTEDLSWEKMAHAAKTAGQIAVGGGHPPVSIGALFMAGVTQALEALGMDHRRIHTERFVSLPDEVLPMANGLVTNELAAVVTLQVTIDGAAYSAPWHAGEKMLDALLAAGILIGAVLGVMNYFL